VRPFGLLGGRYEVDAAGLRKYRLAWAIAIASVMGMALGGLGIPLWLGLSLVAVAFLVTTALCLDVVWKGRKL
jgi:hypothetical protein